MVAHSALTGAELHESKGVASAANKTVYVANGAGSGSWTTLDYQSVPTGSVVGVSAAKTTTYMSTTTAIPVDNTIPQNTEGLQILSVAHTPKATTHLLKIDVTVPLTNTGSSGIATVALFKDSDANAMATHSQNCINSGFMEFVTFTYYMTAGTTSAITFKLRAGPESGRTTYINGNSGGSLYGGTLNTIIAITEYKA